MIPLRFLIVAIAVFSTGSLAEESSNKTGKQVYEQWCSACHSSGARQPGTVALAAKYAGRLPAELEKRTDMTPDYIKTFVRNGVSVMPNFRKTEISDTELNALSAYLSHGTAK